MTCAVVKNAKGSFCAAISGDIFTLKEMTFEEIRRFSSFYVYHPDGGNCLKLEETLVDCFELLFRSENVRGCGIHSKLRSSWDSTKKKETAQRMEWVATQLRSQIFINCLWQRKLTFGSISKVKGWMKKEPLESEKRRKS